MIEPSPFKINQKIVLPDLSEKLDLTSPDFIVKKIFSGGMGTCLKIQNENNSYFALKVIHKDFLKNEKDTARYIKEMKTWLTLSAYNGVVEAFCITKVDGIPCIAAKWMKGGDLRPHLEQKNSAFFYQSMDRIISTLEYVYQKYSIIHRDLKPENILLDVNKNAFVADWGLAKSIAKNSSISNGNPKKNLDEKIGLTKAGSFLGTILYASPEQIRGQKKIDHRSDIYSMGCIMYEWETGSPPFWGNSAQEIAIQHLRSNPKSLGGFLKNTNFRVEKIIHKCLEKEPSKRFKTYEELLNAFQKIASKHSTFEKFIINERYKVPEIGVGEYGNKIKNKSLDGIYSKDGKYAVIDWSELEPYFKESESLMALGEYKKAKEVLESLFVRDFLEETPDAHFTQYICSNLGVALTNIGEIDNAISVLRVLDNAEVKPIHYYLNLSLCYLHKNEYQLAEELCNKGLKIYPSDNELLGNLTIALSNQGKLKQALNSATKRIKISKNAKSLEELALVLYRIAENKKNIDFPDAVASYKRALSYLNEAVKLNPTFASGKLSISNILFKLKKYQQSTSTASNVAEAANSVTELKTAIFYIARNLFWLNNYESCLDFCDKWLEKYPQHTNLQRIRAQNLVDGYVIGNYKDGTRLVEKSSLEFFSNIVKNKKRRLASDYIFLARIHEWMGDENNINYSLQILDKAILAYPNYWDSNLTRAKIYFKINQLEKASEEALIAKRKAPWRENIYSFLVSICEKLDKDKEANAYKEKAYQIREKKMSLYTN
jgi:serine/threonine protein kinase/Tfp pilus assembly protein PilF